MSARLSFFRGGTVHLGNDDAAETHSMPAWMIVVALEAPMLLTHARGQTHARVMVVPPFVERAVHTRGLSVAYFAEPGSSMAPFAAGRTEMWQLLGKERDRVIDLSREVAFGDARDDPARTAEVYAQMKFEHRRCDTRVTQALRLAAAHPDFDVSALARLLRISAVRLRHLVQAETGTALRTHKLWHRTMQATEHLLLGASISGAALGAGFSDHAHFTRSLVRFTGRTPSSIHGDTRVISSYAAQEGQCIIRAPMR